MKIATSVVVFLVSSAVHAEVYKCTTEAGRVIYQSTECGNAGQQTEIAIQPYDQEKVEKAQAKLKKEIDDWQAAKQAKSKAERMQRELQAEQRNLQAASETEEAIRNREELLQNNEFQAILRSNNGRTRGFYQQSVRDEMFPE